MQHNAAVCIHSFGQANLRLIFFKPIIRYRCDVTAGSDHLEVALSATLMWRCLPH
jgi:hypothetical protein